MIELAVMMLILMTCLSLSGCKSVKVVERESDEVYKMFHEEHDSVYGFETADASHTTSVIDSIFRSVISDTIEKVSDRVLEKDSIVMVVDTEGNVVGREVWHDKVRTIERDRTNTETKTQTKTMTMTDSIGTHVDKSVEERHVENNTDSISERERVVCEQQPGVVERIGNWLKDKLSFVFFIGLIAVLISIAKDIAKRSS